MENKYDFIKHVQSKEDAKANRRLWRKIESRFYFKVVLSNSMTSCTDSIY